MPGAKAMITVPDGTKPGKIFTTEVQAAESAQTIEIKRCSVCKRDLEDEMGDLLPNAVELRSCVHMACKSCMKHVQGKVCLAYGRPKPTAASLQHLPCLQELQAPETVLEALLEEYYSVRESERDEKDGKLKEKVDHAKEHATKVINKHYRVTSRKVHPDQNGEEYRPQFDTVKKAHDVLSDSELRRDYLDSMVEIATKFDASYLPRSHQAWVVEHDPAENAAAASSNRKTSVEPG